MAGPLADLPRPASPSSSGLLSRRHDQLTASTQAETTELPKRFVERKGCDFSLPRDAGAGECQNHTASSTAKSQSRRASARSLRGPMPRWRKPRRRGGGPRRRGRGLGIDRDVAMSPCPVYGCVHCLPKVGRRSLATGASKPTLDLADQRSVSQPEKHGGRNHQGPHADQLEPERTSRKEQHRPGDGNDQGSNLTLCWRPAHRTNLSTDFDAPTSSTTPTTATWN